MTQRGHQEVVDRLADAARAAVQSSENPIERMHVLEGIMAWAVKEPHWLAAPYRRLQGAGAYYLLWRDLESDVSLISMVLGPGDQTPIHDHLTWGVVGIYEGLQREKRYVLRSGELCETSDASRRPGAVTTINPPDDDIHFVRSESASGAISVFFMGSNLGCRPRHVYDGGSEEIGISGYANVPCPGQARSLFFVSQFM